MQLGVGRPKETALPSKTSGFNSGNKRVLIVEDKALQALHLAVMLEDLGAQACGYRRLFRRRSP
jgi:hypothetical protein